MKLGALPVDDLKIKCTLFVKLCLCIYWHFEKGKGRGRLWAQMPGLNEMNRFKKKKKSAMAPPAGSLLELYSNPIF